MNHALQPDRQLPNRRWRADGERLEEVARELHPVARRVLFYPLTVWAIARLRQAAFRGIWEVMERAGCSRRAACVESIDCYSVSPRISRGCEASGMTPSRIAARRSGPMRSIRNRPR